MDPLDIIVVARSQQDDLRRQAEFARLVRQGRRRTVSVRFGSVLARAGQRIAEFGQALEQPRATMAGPQLRPQR